MRNVHPTVPVSTRDTFRTVVLNRHDGLCCVPECDQPAVDAHHIIERRLWTLPHEQGGYFPDNGAAVCEPHHYQAEQTIVTADQLREWSNITDALIPSHWYTDQEQSYTKWGDPILADGTRLPGPLFHDPSVQKVLRSAPHVLDLYRDRVKYPRTLHLPWSQGVSSDDKMHANVDAWAGMNVVVTEKMDGECTTVYPDGYVHARSVTPQPHPSRSWLLGYSSQWAYDLPAGWRLVGESLHTVHSLAYDQLADLFLVHSLWNAGECLSWDETTEWAELLGLHTVPVLWRGTFPADNPERVFQQAREAAGVADETRSEGYVVRPAGAFPAALFDKVVGKYVRADHVTADRHWRHRTPTLNRTRHP